MDNKTFDKSLLSCCLTVAQVLCMKGIESFELFTKDSI